MLALHMSRIPECFGTPHSLFSPFNPVLDLFFFSIFVTLRPRPSLFSFCLSYAHCLYNSHIICIPLSITCCLSPSLDVSDFCLSIPLSSSLSIARQAFLSQALLFLHCYGILDSHQEGGSYYHDYAKRLTTCHEKIVSCQGHKN